VEWLREKGLAASQKKAGRMAAEGMAYATVVDGVGVVVEVNSETDFVAKNEKFVDFVKGVATTVAKTIPRIWTALMACKYLAPTSPWSSSSRRWSSSSARTSRSAASPLRRNGLNVPYVHMGGRIGVMVNMEVSAGLEATRRHRAGPRRGHADRRAESPLLGQVHRPRRDSGPRESPS
jgi:elongation factor Ts